MKQTARIISIYSSDTAGVCSVLYELGGLTVVHDASGCNSTYATHDEPRWADMDSMVYISALTEMDAVQGNDERLICDVVRTAEELHPRFIALCGSPMPLMIGTDFPAVAEELERRTGLPVFGFRTNGMDSYLKGASDALSAYLERFCTDAVRQSRSVNIIGATPLDFALNGSVESIRNWLTENGFSIQSCMTMGSTPEEIAGAGGAGVNLVISSCGLKSAEYLRNRFGTPWVCGVPCGKVFAGILAEKLREAERRDVCLVPCADRTVPEGKCLSIVGEPLNASSLAAAVRLECGIPARALCPAALKADVPLAPGDVTAECEDSMAEEFRRSAGILADPLYEPLCPAGAVFHRYPHEAFSGRCFEQEIPDFVNRKLETEMFAI